LEVVVVADNDEDGVHLRWRKEILGKPQLETDSSGSFLAEDVLPLGKVFLWAYHPELGEGFAGPVQLLGSGDTARVEVSLHAAGLEVRVHDECGRPVEGLDIELIAEVIWDSLPVGMSMIEWYRQRASMDLSYYARGMGLVPGARKCQTGMEGSCRWTDLTVGRYQVSLARILHGRDLPDFKQDYFYYWGTLEEPLASRTVNRLEVGWVHDRKLAGRVVDPQGHPQPGLRVQVWFDSLDFPGLKRAYGYSVAHTGSDGAFETRGLGPGPYDISVWDIDDHLTKLREVVEGQGPVTITWSPEKKKEGEVR
jgi:hypothetical protein